MASPRATAVGAGATGNGPDAMSPGEAVAGSSAEGCPCDAAAKAARMPLSCFCADAANAGLCALDLAHIDASTAELCRGNGPILRNTGCGRVSFEPGDLVFEDSSPTFDQATGKLVGVYEGSDIPVLACGVWQVLYGRGLFDARFNPSVIPAADVCPQIDSCIFCGQSTRPNAPPPCP